MAKENFHLEKHSDALKAVVFSRAVQNGVTGCKNLFIIACQKVGYPNLSYVDDAYFDEKIISAIYDYLYERLSNVICQFPTMTAYGEVPTVFVMAGKI